MIRFADVDKRHHFLGRNPTKHFREHNKSNLLTERCKEYEHAYKMAKQTGPNAIKPGTKRDIVQRNVVPGVVFLKKCIVACSPNVPLDEWQFQQVAVDIDILDKVEDKIRGIGRQRRMKKLRILKGKQQLPMRNASSYNKSAQMHSKIMYTAMGDETAKNNARDPMLEIQEDSFHYYFNALDSFEISPQTLLQYEKVADYKIQTNVAMGRE